MAEPMDGVGKRLTPKGPGGAAKKSKADRKKKNTTEP